MDVSNQKKRNQPWSQAPQGWAHVEAKCFYLGPPSVPFKTTTSTSRGKAGLGRIIEALAQLTPGSTNKPSCIKLMATVYDEVFPSLLEIRSVSAGG